MRLKEQAEILTGYLNDTANTLYTETSDDIYLKEFRITDSYQKFNTARRQDNNKYIPGVLNRFDPFVPKSSNGVIVDYLEIQIYGPMDQRDTIEKIFERFAEDYHSVPIVDGSDIYTQYIGKYIYDTDDRIQDGSDEKYFSATLRLEWDLILNGISYDQTSLKIRTTKLVEGVEVTTDEEYPVKVQTYRNDKATIANSDYYNSSTSVFDSSINSNANLVSESLIITVPLNAVTSSSTLWKDINSRTYNRLYRIFDNYGPAGLIEKDWELKTGIINKEENKIVSFTAIFDIPLPRASLVIKYKPLNGPEVEGTVIVTDWGEESSNTLDGRVKNQIVKAQEVRQVNGYTLSFVYESGNPMAKILADRSRKKIKGDRFDITYIYEDLTEEINDLVIEKGRHSFTDNPGVTFTITFAEGV